jgi:hypothetical protein
LSRNIIGFSLFALGVALWVCASLFRFLITSDIPVSFTPEEAMFTQKTFVAAGVLILVGTITAKANAFHLTAFALFSTVAAFQFYMNFSYHSSATYYTEEYAELANVSSYIALALALVNLIFILKPYMRVWKMRVDLKK